MATTPARSRPRARGAGPAGSLRGPALWRTWTLAVTAGECLGFLAPAAVGAAVGGDGVAAGVPVAALLAAGAVEGGALGLAQGWVLRRAVPRVRVGPWAAVTAGAAVVAWAAGLAVAPVVGGGATPVRVVAASLLGAVVLLSLGSAQWLLLRRHLPRAGAWVPATAGAWAVGLAVFLVVTTPLWQPGQAAAVVAAVGALGGLAMAATVAALTGVAVVRLTRPAADR